MIRPSFRLFAILCGMVAIASHLPAQELPLPIADLKRTDPVDFATEIAPVLKQNCVACHHKKEAEGGLVLESIAGIREGGDSGKGVVPHDVDASLLWTRASGVEEPLMPPEDNTVDARPLNPKELALLKLWIQQGATGTDVKVSQPIQWQAIPETIRAVYAMDVSPDGQLAAVGRGNRVVLIDLSTQQQVAHLEDPRLGQSGVVDVDLIQSIRFAPDANRLATGGFRSVKIWKRVPRSLDATAATIQSASGWVAPEPEGSMVALVNAIGDVEVWNQASNQRVSVFRGHADRVSGLAWIGSDRIVSCDLSGRLVLWRASTGELLCESMTGTPLVRLVASHVSAEVALIDVDGHTHLYHPSDDEKSLVRGADSIDGIEDATSLVIADQPQPMLVVASESKGVVLFDLKKHSVLRTIDHGNVVDALAVIPQKQQLVTGGRDGKAKIWKLADGSAVRTIEGDRQTSLRVAQATRDAQRQAATIERLTKTTAELNKRLETENAAFKKASEEHKKATEGLAAEEKKSADAVAAVAATEDQLAQSKEQAERANAEISAASQLLAAAKSNAEEWASSVAVKTSELATVQASVNETQQQIARLLEVQKQAENRAAEIQKVISERNSALSKARADIAAAQSQIEAATKRAEQSKADSEKAIKELEAKRKSLAEAEKAKANQLAEVAKRSQALDTATGAKQRAEAAIPQHETVLAVATRQQVLLKQIVSRVTAQAAGPGKQVAEIAINADASRVATASVDGSIRVFRTVDGQSVTSFQSSNTPTGLVFVGDALCAIDRDGAPSMWSCESDWKLERTIGSIDDASMISDRVTALDFRRDGLTLAIGSGSPSRSGEVKVVAVETGSVVRDFGEVHSDNVLGLAFSPDGHTLASSAADKTIRLLDVASGEVIRSLEGHTHHVLGIAWQDDGQTIASAGADREVKIWNAATGEQRRTIKGFSKETTAVTFVDTSNQIVTACADGVVRLTDTSNGKAIRTFNAQGDFLFAVSVTPDGNKLLAAGESGVVRVWTLADGKLLYELK